MLSLFLLHAHTHTHLHMCVHTRTRPSRTFLSSPLAVMFLRMHSVYLLCMTCGHRANAFAHTDSNKEGEVGGVEA